MKRLEMPHIKLLLLALSISACQVQDFDNTSSLVEDQSRHTAESYGVRHAELLPMQLRPTTAV